MSEDDPDAAIDGATSVEKRVRHRQRVLKEGRVVLADKSTLDCTIRDLTAEGAKLAFVNPTPLPSTFSLLLVSAGTITPAKLLWQKSLSAGIAFTGPTRPASAHAL